MVLAFQLPGKLQVIRKRMFYWRAVYYYRLAMQHDFLNRKVLHRFSRFFLGVLAIKMLQKGARARKEEKIVDYSTRKANVAAAETALWDEELALHTPDAAEAETSVQRQREMEWRFRAKDQEWATLTQIWKFPFVPVPLKKDAAQLK